MNDHAAQARRPLIIPAENLVKALLIRFQKSDEKFDNTSIEIYTNMPYVTVFDMMWDDDWEDFHFNDYTHMSKDGEVLFATKLIQYAYLCIPIAYSPSTERSREAKFSIKLPLGSSCL